jgi:hypothetical protein
MALIINGTDGVQFNDASLQGAAASPFGLKNRIINGDMRIDQRNAGASITANDGVFPVDRFQMAVTQSSKGTVQQSSTAPAGFVNSLLFTSSSAYSVLSTDTFAIRQQIEGLNVADLGWGTANAQTITLSFWVRSSLTGTFGGSLANSAVTRSYPFSYTISAANTWEQKSITIAGDTSGTWLTTNGIGIRLWFGLGQGSTYTTTAGAWASGDYRNATGATSVVGTNGATFYITGVQLEQNTSATPFERRLYNQELANCQRYYYKLKSEATGTRFGSLFCETTTLASGLVNFPTSMRTKPTSLEQSGTATDYTVIAGNVAPACNAVPTFGVATIDCSSVALTVASGLTTGFGGQIRAANANAFLAWSAEL